MNHNQIKTEFQGDIAKITSVEEINNLRVKYLGRKGVVTLALRELGKLPQTERPKAGKALNQLQAEIRNELSKKQKELSTDKFRAIGETEKIDITVPGIAPERGSLHPVGVLISEMEDIFRRLGYSIVRTREVEDDWHNFEGLNVPADHPAKDMWDTFYVNTDSADNSRHTGRVHLSTPGEDLADERYEEELEIEKGELAGLNLLRTHTSTAQTRIMEEFKPPMKVISSGRVYRYEAEDATHLSVFHQLEGFAVDKNLTMADLKGTLTHLFQSLFGSDIKIRFRPSFFPFTEPSAEVDVTCIFCKGKGCKSCGGAGWLELLGAGMIHPNVLRNMKIDPAVWQGFAFGMGPDRIAMLRHGVDDVRQFFSGDLRFLRQL